MALDLLENLVANKVINPLKMAGFKLAFLIFTQYKLLNRLTCPEGKPMNGVTNIHGDINRSDNLIGL